jgi:hypothetical protein
MCVLCVHILAVTVFVVVVHTHTTRTVFCWLCSIAWLVPVWTADGWSLVPYPPISADSVDGWHAIHCTQKPAHAHEHHARLSDRGADAMRMRTCATRLMDALVSLDLEEIRRARVATLSPSFSPPPRRRPSIRPDPFSTMVPTAVSIGLCDMITVDDAGC